MGPLQRADTSSTLRHDLLEYQHRQTTAKTTVTLVICINCGDCKRRYLTQTVTYRGDCMASTTPILITCKCLQWIKWGGGSARLAPCWAARAGTKPDW